MSQRASRWEIAGAWLHVWTPPRGVEVPDPPWLRIALVAALVLAGLGGAIALFAPDIQRGKARTAEREARREAAYFRSEFARLRRDQRLLRGRASLGRDLTPAQREARLTQAVAAAVAAEARRRHTSGELESPTVARTARCRRRDSSTTQRLRLSCLAPTSYVDRGDGKRAGFIGYPFLAGGSPRTGRFTFCKTNPPPGENFARFGNRAPPALPAACAF